MSFLKFKKLCALCRFTDIEQKLTRFFFVGCCFCNILLFECHTSNVEDQCRDIAEVVEPNAQPTILFIFESILSLFLPS